MQTVSETPHWEQYKENAAPLARGRNVKKLSRALAPQCTSSVSRQENDKNISNFDRLVRPSEKFSTLFSENRTSDEDDIKAMLRKCRVDKDPMVHWARYIKYHEETYPSDTHAQFSLMERCTQALLHHPKYKNDVRFIRVCVLYADRTENPGEQFKLFHKHKLGNDVAIFWLAWAWVAETKKDFQFAEKIFRKALQKKAKPEKIVGDRYKQFQRRMSRHWLNANAEEAASVYDGDGDEDNQVEANNRGALSGLTEEGVRQNSRAQRVNAMASARPLAVNNGQSGPPRIANKTKSPPQDGGFVVFSEEDKNDQHGYDLNQSRYGDENTPLPLLVKEKDRRKENVQEAESWNQRGGLRGTHTAHAQNHTDYDDRMNEGTSSVVQRWAGTGGDAMTAGGVEAQPAFSVFVDEECNENENKSDTVRPTKQAKFGERVLRQRSDEGMGRVPLGSGKGVIKGIAVHQDKKRSDRGPPKISSRSREVTTAVTTTSISKSGKTSTGFDTKIIAKDRNGSEVCFEEYRAKKRMYKLSSRSTDFNLLHRMNEVDHSTNNSCMDIDDGSTVEDEDMGDISHSLSAMDLNRRHARFHPDVISDEKKLNLNSSTGSALENRSSYSRDHNTSTASSTVDERTAVGVVGDREETLNTKFAARELSMMFSSPGGAMSQSTLGTSRVGPDKLLFSIHHDADESLDEPTNIKDNAMSKAQRPARKVNVASSVENKDAFAIFCEDEADSKPNGRGGGFTIYEENDSDTSDDGSYIENEKNGDTASLADIMEIMKDTSPLKAAKKPEVKAGGFAIFCDDEENGTILTEDTAAFGDLSCIVNENDTYNLHDKMKGMAITGSRRK